MLSVIYKLHLVITLALLLAVLVVFVSPVADLPSTALRSQQAALLVILSIALAAHRVLLRFLPTLAQQLTTSPSAPLAPLSSPSMLTCVLLC